MALEVMSEHLFVKHDPKSSASYVADQFKGFTSRVLREEFPHLKSGPPRLWSSSYFAVSVGSASAETVRRHIDTQWERVQPAAPLRVSSAADRQAADSAGDVGRPLLPVQRPVAGTPRRIPAPVEDQHPLR